MSQNPDERPDEAREAAKGKEFESGLDYGAFASDDADFPEDQLDSTDQQGADQLNSAQSTAGKQDAASPGGAPTAESPSQSGGVGPRSLSEELAAEQAGSSSAPSEQGQSVPGMAASDENTTRVVPPAGEQSTTALPPQGQAQVRPEEQAEFAGQSAQPVPGNDPQQPGEPAPVAAPPGGYAPVGSDEEITDADIEEEVTKSKRGVSRFLTVLVALFTPVLLVVGAIRLVGTPLFLWVTYQRPGFPDDPHGFGLDDRMLYGSYGMDFLFNLADYRYLANLTDGDGEALFTSTGEDLNEVSHMMDVKEVVWIAMLVGLGVLLLALIFMLLLRAWRPGGFARGLFAGAWATIALLIGTAVFAVLDWQRFFTEFHNLLFSGNWEFPDDYTLIRLYPNQFWVDAGIWIAGLMLVASILLLIITWPTKARRVRRADRLSEVHDKRREKLIEELNATA